MTYTVALTNTTAKAVTLLPCPGYLQEIRSSAAGVVTASRWRLYRLNCRPVDHIAPRAKLRFEMVAEVAAEAVPGGTVAIVWKLQTAQNLPSDHLVGVLNLTVTSGRSP